MLRPKLVNNGAFGAGHISGAVMVACLIIGWSRPAFSAEPIAAPEEHLQLAPIWVSRTFSGDIGYTLQRTSFGASKYIQQSFGVGVAMGVNVRSFFWQPWLAQVSSNLNGNVNNTRTSNSTSATRNSVNTSIDGDAALNLVKSSRFPFEARIYRSDNKYAAFYSGAPSVTRRTGYSLSQDYISRNRKLKGNAFFTSGKASSPTGSPSYSDMFNSDLLMPLTQNQSIKISYSSFNANQPGGGTSYLRNALMANHSYRPNSIFSLASQADLFKTNQGQMQGSIPTQNDFNSLQLSSFASWRPAKSPLTVTSNVRFYRADISSNGILAPAMTSSNFNLGANYLFSSLIRLYGAINVADSLGVQTTSANMALTAAKGFGYGVAPKNAASTDLGGFRYSRSIGGTISTSATNTTSANITSTNGSNQTTSQDALNLNLNLGLSLGHALSKISTLGSGRLSTNLNQSVSISTRPVSIGAYSSSTNSSISNSSNSNLSITNLVTGGSLSWNRAEGRGTTLFRLSAADSRDLHGTRPAFQMINLQASRSEAVGHNESLQGSLTMQATHQESVQLNIAPSAAIKYRNERLFKVRKLTFESELRITDSNIAPGSIDLSARSLNNKFGYQVGRMRLSLNANMSVAGNASQTWLMFIMSRPF